MERFHILALNLSHLAAVENVLRTAVPSGGAEIIGLLVPTDPESLTQVARLRPGTRLGVVCDLPSTLEALGGLVRGYNPGITVASSLSTDDTAVHRIVEAVDVLLVTASASARVRSFEPSIPIIEVSFKPDERSVQQLGALVSSCAWRAHQPSPGAAVLDAVTAPAATARTPRRSPASERDRLAGVSGR